MRILVEFTLTGNIMASFIIGHYPSVESAKCDFAEAIRKNGTISSEGNRDCMIINAAEILTIMITEL